MPDPTIRVRNLSKHYSGPPVVHNVSFELAAGETLVLLGPSGCGKTTLLKMLNCLIEPSSGTVEVNGQDVQVQRPEQLRRGIGYVIQQVGLLPHYTVAENVGVVPRLLGHAPAAVAARTEALLTRLHLPPARFANQYPHQLSGGQQQRVGLARALAADPPIILLDEPFGALDPITRASIRREFRELDELRRKTIVLVTHDVTEAFELADRIALLDGGQIQQLGTPRELLFRPANDFVRRFFAAERLSLQLRTLTLADLLPFLPDSGMSDQATVSTGSDDKAVRLPSTTVREAVAQLTAAEPANPEAVAASVAAAAASVGSAAAARASVDTSAAAFNRSEAPVSSLEVPFSGAKEPIAGLETLAGSSEVPSGSLAAPFTSSEAISDPTQAVVDTAKASFRATEASSPGPVAPPSHWLLVADHSGAAPRPITLPQLMAAFGRALQHEEAA